MCGHINLVAQRAFAISTVASDHSEKSIWDASSDLLNDILSKSYCLS
jgi:hypothetical protein